MSTRVAIAHRCDEQSCTAVITGDHWTALGAQSEARAALRQAGWITERVHAQAVDVTLHFCPDHADAPRQRRYDGRGAADWIWSTP